MSAKSSSLIFSMNSTNGFLIFRNYILRLSRVFNYLEILIYLLVLVASKITHSGSSNLLIFLLLVTAYHLLTCVVLMVVYSLSILCSVSTSISLISASMSSETMA